jgi:hypothetical protein
MTREHDWSVASSSSHLKAEGTLTDVALDRDDGDAVEDGRWMEMCALCKGSAGVSDLDISHVLEDPELYKFRRNLRASRGREGCDKKRNADAASGASWHEHPPISIF